MKGTQVFPWGFAQAYFDMVQAVDFKTLLLDLPEGQSFSPQTTDLWREADAEQMADLLAVPIDRAIA